MTPQEKAKELIAKFKYLYIRNNESKQCTLICVDEILILLNEVAGIQNNYFRGTETGGYVDTDVEENYWKKVKEELTKL